MTTRSSTLGPFYFAIFGGIALAAFKDFPPFRNMNSFLAGGILFVIGAVFGELLHRATKKYSKRAQYVTLALMIVVLMTISIIFPQKPRNNEPDISDYVPISNNK